MLALRSGRSVLYGILGLGYHFNYPEARYQLEGGLGAHVITARAFRMSAELSSTARTYFEDGVYGQQRCRVPALWHILPYGELIAGPTSHPLHLAERKNTLLNTSH